MEEGILVIFFFCMMLCIAMYCMLPYKDKEQMVKFKKVRLNLGSLKKFILCYFAPLKSFP